MPKVKDKEKILKAAKENQLVTYRGVHIRCQLISQKKLCRLEGIGKKHSKSCKAGIYSQYSSTQQSYHLESKDI